MYDLIFGEHKYFFFFSASAASKRNGGEVRRRGILSSKPKAVGIGFVTPANRHGACIIIMPNKCVNAPARGKPCEMAAWHY